MGGRLVVVGGWVRDGLNGGHSKDLDLEIFGASQDEVTTLLSPFGFTKPVGRKFPVWRQMHRGIDVALPRGGGERYRADGDDSLDEAFREASRHRDLTINAIGWDPMADRVIDPWDGQGDLQARLLRAVSLETFGSDPLRVLRVARLKARFEAQVDSELDAICRGLDLQGLASERVAAELWRILCECPRPSLAFEFLASIEQLGIFAPIEALQGVVQDPKWHPEGDVFVHTCLVIDRAAAISREEALCGDQQIHLMVSALCHDLGKPATTTIEVDGRIRSLQHEAKSAEITHSWLSMLCLGEARIRAVVGLVADHLAPAQFVSQGAGARAYRRLARRLEPACVTVVELERLARADHLGRTTAEARAGRFEAGERFLEAARNADIHEGVRPDVVSASMLMARGIVPGPELGRMLARCREIEDETGSQDAASIAEKILREFRAD
jgi:tRNA nucleotidyltransferase (CCA-adding enzyme)